MKASSFNGFWILLLLFPVSLFLSSVSAFSPTGSIRHPVKFIIGSCLSFVVISEYADGLCVDLGKGEEEENLGSWKSELTQVAPAPGPKGEDVLILAANRTNRPDILRGFQRYRGGWDIADQHYWASVGFTGAAGFILAVLWFISFGLALMIHLCCGWGINIKDKGSNHSQRICLILLISFTFAAA
ncbi:hypothetical protein GmHk_10G030363 [Glycine max]|nr:hypothetical protein GmHk_10G030363 [Glycine max]